MAGFCRNCGSPLADGQGFCAKCGTRVGDAAAQAAAAAKAAAAPPAAPRPPAPSVAPPQSAAPVYAAPVVQAPPVAAPVAARPAGMSTLAKILIAIVIIFVVFGAVAVAGLMYIGHRVHEKATELGLTKSDAEREVSDAQLHRINGCKLLPKSAVSAAVKMEIVRAENGSGEAPGCVYDVAGDSADLTAKHITAMHKSELNQDQQNMVQQFASTIFKSGSNSQGPSEHPGEAPVIAFSIDNNAADLQMKLNRGTLGRLGPGLVPIPGLGDEAFDAYGAMMFVRKGDKLVRIIYMGCPCVVEDVVPLARTIVAGL